MWEDPNLTPFQTVLLAEIDSLDTGEGCWMSSKEMAKKMACSISHLDNTVSELKKQKYLFTVKKYLRRRYLRTAFSRHLVNKSSTFYSRSDLPSRVDSSLSTIKSSIQAKRGFSKKPRRDLGVSTENSFEGKIVSKFFTWAEKKRLLAGRPKPRLDKWRQALCQLMAPGCDENVHRNFLKVLKWYFDHFRDEYVPQCYSLITFCQKFHQVEAAWRRWVKKNRGKSGHWEKQPYWVTKGDREVKKMMSVWIEDEV